MTQGIVISCGSGVVNMKGVISGFVGEIISISSHDVLLVNLTRDDCLNLILGGLCLESKSSISVGSEANGTSTLASIHLGDHILGSILDPLGHLILSSSRVSVEHRWVIESPAPGILQRESVFEPLQTGLISIDSMIPIGRGQRELIVGDRQVGKTSIGLDVMINQQSEGVFSVYVPISQKASSVLEVFIALMRRDVTKALTMLIACASDSAVCQYLSSYSGTSVSEFFMLVREKPSFIMLDNLSSQAVAYREISLLLSRPPGREAYPGEIFFVHSRLLERMAKLSKSFGSGSITSFPVVETLAGDVSSYITTNVISITDGQLFLSVDLFLSGIKPSLDVGLSVSRVGSSAQWSGMKVVSGSYKLELAQFAELESFSQFASDLGEQTRDKINRGKSLVEMLKQPVGNPMSLSVQLSILSLADQYVFKSFPLSEITPTLAKIRSLPLWILLILPQRLICKAILYRQS